LSAISTYKSVSETKVASKNEVSRLSEDLNLQNLLPAGVNSKPETSLSVADREKFLDLIYVISKKKYCK